MAKLETAIGTFLVAQADEVLSSPVGWAIPWSPAGATPRGKLTSRPHSFVFVVQVETLMRTRERRRRRFRDFVLAWMVSWSVEPELKNSRRDLVSRMLILLVVRSLM